MAEAQFSVSGSTFHPKQPAGSMITEGGSVAAKESFETIACLTTQIYIGESH